MRLVVMVVVMLLAHCHPAAVVAKPQEREGRQVIGTQLLAVIFVISFELNSVILVVHF